MFFIKIIYKIILLYYIIYLGEEDSQLVPPTMSDEAVAQAWYRLLRTIGDPVDLCRPAVISQTQAFLQYAIASPNVIDPCQHPCLQSLPQIFLKAIKGIAGQVDAFLGKFSFLYIYTIKLKNFQI